MISFLSCGFAARGSERLFDRRAPLLTEADPDIWHGCGTNLSRRQPATSGGRRRTRVPLYSQWLSPRCPLPSTRASDDGQDAMAASEHSAWRSPIDLATLGTE